MIYNADNPYVQNEYFYANVTDQKYEDTLLSKIHFAYNFFAFIFGTSTCCLLFYLTIKRTPQIFKDYSKLIFVTCLIDLVYLLINFGCQFRFKLVDGALLASVTGPLKYLPYVYQCGGLPSSSAIQATSCLVLPYIYMYRFLIIKHKKPPKLYQTLIYLLFCITFVSVLFYAAFQGYCSDYKTNQLEYAHLWYTELKVPSLIIGFNSNKMIGLSFTLYGGSNLICYIIAMTIGYKTTREIQRHALHLSHRTLMMQKSLSNALFFQSLIPLTGLLLPFIIAAIPLIFKVDLLLGGEYINFSIAFHPILSSMSNLLFISYYRNFVLKAFPCCVKNADNVVSVAPLSSQQTN